MKTVEIVIRSYIPIQDDPYIYSSWTRYAWYSAQGPIALPKREWFALKIREIKEILAHGDVHVACFSDDPTSIAGYIAVQDHAVKWLCVKKIYHHQGIEQLLTHSMKEQLHDPAPSPAPESNA